MRYQIFYIALQVAKLSQNDGVDVFRLNQDCFSMIRSTHSVVDTAFYRANESRPTRRIRLFNEAAD